MCKTRILSQKESTIIVQCVNCDVLNIWHNNLLLNFSMREFRSFKRIVNNLSFPDRSLSFPDGKRRIILRTPNDDISFTFDIEEFKVFKETIDEAIYMAEVYAMMR
ncbi:MAG: DUF6686 family protein [Sphingobacterium sp.]